MPIQKYYTDYEPIVTHEQVPYTRKFNENLPSILGNHLPVETTKTDYQTIEHTTYKPIQGSFGGNLGNFC